MSCKSEETNQLPLINIKFGSLQKTALIDTGANISLIQATTLEKIKKVTKVEYISRSVRIKTIDNSCIPYLSAVKIKFKIENKWFDSVFFVTKKDWDSNYEIILGYDCIQTNKILIDSINNCIIIDNTKLHFLNHKDYDQESISNESKFIKEVNVNAVRVCHMVDIEPGQSKFVTLSIPASLRDSGSFIFIPNVNKLNYNIQNSLHEYNENNKFTTIIENNSNQKIRIRKKTKIGVIQKFHEEDIVEPTDQIGQVNTISLEKVKQMRKEELNPNQFNLNHLNGKVKEEILQLLINNYSVFSSTYSTLGSTDKVVPEFKLYHDYALQTKPYPIPKIAKEYAQEEIKKLLDAGIIEPSSSNYCFPVIFVKKKPLPGEGNKQKFRMAIDYRLLNCITESHKICLPKIMDIIQNIAGKNWYSVLDLKSAFFQIQLKDKDKEKLAFCCELGNFQPCRLPFGAKNSTSYFHTLMSKCLKDIQGSNIQFFLDDIILASDTIQEMKCLLQQVFERLEKFNLTLDPAKMQICENKITYLGFELNKSGYSPSEENVRKVTKFPIPKNVKEVQSYLGMLNYFRHLIFNFAELAQPIVNLTKKNSEFIWDQKCQDAFNKFQDMMLTKPTLKNIKHNEKLYLITDASKVAVCGILMQKSNGKFVPIEFYSKQLNPAEMRYPSIRRELYAIFLSVKHFSEHLYGREFSILTDAKPLSHHIHLDKQPDIVARWLLYLQSFSYSIEHVPGFSNPADFLTRVQEETHVNNLKIFPIPNGMNYDNIKSHQQKDEETKEIIDKINDDNNVTCKDYYMDNNSGLLMIKMKPRIKHLRNKHIENKIVIPKSLVKTCLESAHGPHFGTTKTFNVVKKNYYWKNYFLDTKNFCENCHECIKNKSKPTNTQFEMISKSHLAPGQFIAIDIVGKLPRSYDGKFFILTIIDHYSRFLEAIPL
ncbi:Transposon Tf2-9 polyprotein, partial [Araneus ventricosus]